MLTRSMVRAEVRASFIIWRASQFLQPGFKPGTQTLKTRHFRTRHFNQAPGTSKPGTYSSFITRHLKSVSIYESKIEVVSSRLPICQFGSILVTKYQLLYLRRFETDFDNFEICYRAIRFLSIPLLFMEVSMHKSSLCAVILKHQSPV